MKKIGEFVSNLTVNIWWVLTKAGAFIGNAIIELATIIWNIMLDVWQVAGDFIKFSFIGIILPILTILTAYKITIFMGPEPNGYYDGGILMLAIYASMLTFAVSLSFFIDAVKEKKANS